MKYKMFIEWKCPICGHKNLRRRYGFSSILHCTHCYFSIDTAGIIEVGYNRKLAEKVKLERAKKEKK